MKDIERFKGMLGVYEYSIQERFIARVKDDKEKEKFYTKEIEGIKGQLLEFYEED